MGRENRKKSCAVPFEGYSWSPPRCLFGLDFRLWDIQYDYPFLASLSYMLSPATRSNRITPDSRVSRSPYDGVPVEPGTVPRKWTIASPSLQKREIFGQDRPYLSLGEICLVHSHNISHSCWG